MTTAQLTENLQKQVTQQLQLVTTELQPLTLQHLNYKTNPDSWSMLECLEHLNRYARYYLPELQTAMAVSAGFAGANQLIKRTWLGNYSIKMADPANTKKAKTLKHLNPNNSLLTQQTISECIEPQNALLDLLKHAGKTDLNRKAIKLEFMKLLKLRIAETLEFVVLHQQRHLQQALRAKAAVPNEQPAVLVV